MTKPTNIKIKNKNKLNKSNESQNDYLQKKKSQVKKSGQNSQLDNEVLQKNLKEKKREEKKKKLEKRSNTIVIKDKLKEPASYFREDSSFFDQDIFNESESNSVSSSKYDKINLNENYESDLFNGMIDEFNGEDLDILDYNDNVKDYADDFNSEDEEFYGAGDGGSASEDDEGDQDNNSNNNSDKKINSNNNNSNNNKSNKLELNQDLSFPVNEIQEQDDDDDENSKKKKKSGGFQSMGLNKVLLKSILKKGFNVPTPIQRRTIPLILEGNDVVGMARTGSGKTGAFVIPMIQKLQEHSTVVGVRAIILSPTRELAIQTFKVVKDFSQGTNLRTVLIVGGDSMEDQFTDLARNPDIIIATPGRLMHHLQETGMSLSKVRYIVFDEADRLFEMGFNEQLTEILGKLSENRQTLLFSATLPSLLVDFVRAGLNNPKLVRLDTDTKISENLALSFFTVRHDEKLGVLLYLLKEIILIDKSTKSPTIIFTATKYHVEFIHILLERAGISSTYIHGYLDPVARKINLAKFRTNQVSIMIVTDLAARGIDIPLLDNVINFDFPPKEKIFVHRVGRVARAGKKGIAYSLVSPDEVPYMIDLHLYLGRKFINKFEFEGQTIQDPKFSFYGTIPQYLIDEETEFVNTQKKECVELLSLTRTIENAHKKYLSMRPGASHESNNRAKALDKTGYHPILSNKISNDDHIQQDFIQQLKSFRPRQNVLEMDARKNNTQVAVMREKRKIHSSTIESQQKKVLLESSETNLGPDNKEFDYSKKHNKRIKDIDGDNITEEMLGNNNKNNNNNNSQHDSSEEEEEEEEEEEMVEDNINNKFNVSIQESNNNNNSSSGNGNSKKKTRSSSRDLNFFISNTPENLHEERALSITNKFTKDIEVNLNPDTERKQKKSMVWDKRKGKFVSANAEQDRKNAKKLVRNEAGVLVQAKKGHKGYDEWKKKTRSRIQKVGEDENEKYQPHKKDHVPMKWRGQDKQRTKQESEKNEKKKPQRNELKDKHTLIKNRNEKERKMKVNKSKGKPSKGGKGGKSGGGSKFGGKGKGGKGRK